MVIYPHSDFLPHIQAIVSQIYKNYAHRVFQEATRKRVLIFALNLP